MAYRFAVQAAEVKETTSTAAMVSGDT